MKNKLNTIKSAVMAIAIGLVTNASFATDNLKEENNISSQPYTAYNYAVDGVANMWDAGKNTVYAVSSFGYDAGMIGHGVYKGASAVANAANCLWAEDDNNANALRKQAAVDLTEAKDSLYKGVTNIPTTLGYGYNAASSLGYGVYNLGTAGAYGVQAAVNGVASGASYISNWWYGQAPVATSSAMVPYDPAFAAQQRGY